MEKYKRNPNVECAICKKPHYQRPKTLLMNSGRSFCSQSCYGISCRKPIPCLVCGKEVLASRHAKTCSKVCANKRRVGTKYAKGIATRPKKCIVTHHQTIRKRLIEIKGEPKCERCGYNKIPEVVVIHHIVERSKGGTDDMDNLEFLCPTCHSEEHYIRKQSEGAGVGSPNGLETRSIPFKG